MRKIKFEYRITAGYLIVGGIWILFSDLILESFIENTVLLTRFQTYKGWFYVIITAILLYLILKKHLVNLRKAEHEAKESDRLKTAFLQNISHEIRTPMNSIIGFSDLLKNSSFDETKRKEFLEIISSSSNQLLSIVNDLLDISMIESGNIKVIEKPVHLNNMLDDIHKSFVVRMKPEVSLSLLKELPDIKSIILTDETKLRQIITNLLNNAVKFTDSGFIKYGYTLKNAEIEFYIKDSGIGIQSEMLNKVFNRFLKVDQESDRLYDGVGLGLSICKGNADVLKGSISVKSTPGKGSGFFVKIPFKPVIHPDISEEKTESLHFPSENLLVLIVEDNNANNKFIQKVLDSERISHIEATNGSEAVELCKQNPKIGLVLMDLKMPVMNGFEATTHIKKYRPGIKIIVQTAYASEKEKSKAMTSGCDDYISKPFTKKELLSIIAKHHTNPPGKIQTKETE
jgi:signal transduction histidine kinase/CheY-like chemotaxis protein